MPPLRKTAILQLQLPSDATRESLPLTLEREFGVTLTIASQNFATGSFRSPINDEQWRDFVRKLRDCNVRRDESGFNAAQAIRAVGGLLYKNLAALAPELQAFLDEADVPRRLVIQTTRTELHLLPWGALYSGRKLLAAGDLSVVQSWDSFGQTPMAFAGRLNLVRQLGSDTNKASAAPLRSLPPEISQDPAGEPDILHLEEHGDAALSEIGGQRATAMAKAYERAKIGLLWSCYSGAANSWGESPALCLHRSGAGLVLSFQAELNVLDAKSISESFYSEVFGPAATRDPESALLRIRAAKYENEFAFANWASMMIYLRSPLDLSALPLNGDRVPRGGWVAGAPDEDWQVLSDAVARLQPGTRTSMELPTVAAQGAKLPLAIAKLWRGNVVRLDGSSDPLSDATIAELNLDPRDAPSTDASDRLIWFFKKIEHYGAPLVIWTNAERHQAEFLEAIQASASLTFLLLFGVEAPPTLARLVDRNRLTDAQSAAEQLPLDCADDDLLSAGYFAYARCELPADALRFLRRINDEAERSLLSGNFISRFQVPPESYGDGRDPPEELTQQHLREDCYRAAIDFAGATLSVTGRAKHELGYFYSCQKREGTAEVFYRLALLDLERSPDHDSRWQFALAGTLRDWADLLASEPERLPEASQKLSRALAIHSFYGRDLEIAYCLASAAKIARTGCHHSEAIAKAMDAANRFDRCNNWRGWSAAVDILLSVLAETRESAQMLSVVDLAIAKIEVSNIEKRSKKDSIQRSFRVKRAEAYWILGDLDMARSALDDVFHGAPQSFVASDPGIAAVRLQRFISPVPS